jgi:hypothetical protein
MNDKFHGCPDQPWQAVGDVVPKITAALSTVVSHECTRDEVTHHVDCVKASACRARAGRADSEMGGQAAKKKKTVS